METVAAKLPKSLVDAVDGIVAAGSFPNRSEVLRVAVREFLEARGRAAGRATPLGTRVRRRAAEARILRTLARDPQYRNRFVALFRGQVLDSDGDLQALVRRVLDRPEHPVHIARATERGETATVRFPGVRVRRP